MRIKTIFIKIFKILIILILINFSSSKIFTLKDLTSEKRYSISQNSKEFIKKINDNVYIEVYLIGDFPSRIEKLESELKYFLSEIKKINNYFEIKYVNILEENDLKTRNEILYQISEKGISPTTLKIKENNSYTEKMIIPGAIIKYNSKESSVQLLNNNIYQSSNENIEESIKELEYKFLSALKNIIKIEKKSSIGLILGENINKNDIVGLKELLNIKYKVKEIDIREYEINNMGEPDFEKKIKEFQSNDLIFLINPTEKFEEIDKYLIDQYIMNGGKTFWAIDVSNSSMDSLKNKGSFIAHKSRTYNLNDLLFNYGIRINNDIISDLSCAKIPVPVSFIDNKPSWELLPWEYFPVSIPISKHPITSNLNLIKFDFISSIDTVNFSSNIKKTVLLKSSEYSKLNNLPFQINLKQTFSKIKQNEYKNGPKNLAVLLEGTFNSAFKNRYRYKSNNVKFKEKSKENKIFVVSDKDFLINKYYNGNRLPLSLDKYDNIRYGNENFILNSIDYMLEKNDFLNLRNKEIKLRRLNLNKINNYKTLWQFFNIIPAIIIIIISLIVKFLIRKRKYENF